MRFLVVLAADSGDAFVPAEGRQVCIRTQVSVKTVGDLSGKNASAKL